MIIALRQDVAYALRTLRRTPGLTAAALMTLALGIGATTTIFTVVDAVLLKPLSFPEPWRLTMVWPTSGSRVSAGYFHDWRLESRSFQDMAAWRDVRVNLTGAGAPTEIKADRTTTNFFAVLGTPPLVGRTFTTGQDLNDVQPEVVLSHGFWQRQFGADPALVGQAMTLDGQSYTVIGIMPADFVIRTTEWSESHAEIWMPFPLTPGNRVGMGGFLNAVGRLAPGATSQAAQAELTVISQRIEREHPSYSSDWGVTAVPLHAATVRDVRAMLLVLFGAVGLLQLVACANVANLALSRGVARETELGIRLSLGASRGRLLRQLLTESFVLAAAGGALGVALAMGATKVLIAARPAGLDLPRTGLIAVDLRVLAFAIIATTATAVLFGLVPALHLTRSASDAALRPMTRGSSPDRRRTRLGNALIVSEVALAVMLLAGGGLLMRSFWTLSRVDPGFRPEQVLTMRITLPASRYGTDDRIRAFGGELFQRIEALPGVRAVGVVDSLPMSRMAAANVFEIEGRAGSVPQDQRGSWINVVGRAYFDAMGIPLIRGRVPGPADTATAAPVLVIDEKLAREYWPDTDPIGERLRWRRGDDDIFTGEIVGIVGSVQNAGMAQARQGTTYFWFAQNPRRDLTLAVRTSGDPVAMAALVASEVRAIDPNQPVADVRPMREYIAEDLARPRFTMTLLGCFAVAALLLAAVGLYGVISFRVTQRTREIGVRVALGAQNRDVLRLVMGKGLVLTGAGVAIGIAAALALGRVAAGFLYGVTPTDPPTLLAVSVLLTGVAVVATYLPARRAMRLDAAAALRCD